ncbi:MAG TPA: hypothetical protein VM577_09970 [Anaerovoracaceae bacterium]|nr:hypothetical protein [Anaerovoracaceae bacterium]
MQNKEDIIIITAAGKSTWLRERLPGGWARGLGERLIGGYKEKMEILRGVDDRVYEWLSDFKQVVNQMRRAAEANRLVDVAILLHNLNTKLNNVKQISGEVKKLEDSDVAPFEKEHEGVLPEEDLFSVDDNGFVSEAGMWSDFKRRWVAKHLESKERRERSMAIRSLITTAETVADDVEKYLSEMSKARASGDIGAYVDVLNRVSKKQIEFKSKFVPVYNKYLAPVVNKVKEERKAFLDRANRDEAERLHKLHEEEKKAPEKIPETVDNTMRSPVPESEPSASSLAPTNKQHTGVPATESMSIPSVPATEPSSGPVTNPTSSGPSTMIESHPPTELESVYKVNENGEVEESGPRTMPSAASTEVERIILKQNHIRFVEEMVKVASSDDPFIISAMLLKYAEEIEEVDLKKSLELLAIAEGIINE